MRLIGVVSDPKVLDMFEQHVVSSSKVQSKPQSKPVKRSTSSSPQSAVAVAVAACCAPVQNPTVLCRQPYTVGEPSSSVLSEKVHDMDCMVERPLSSTNVYNVCWKVTFFS